MGVNSDFIQNGYKFSKYNKSMDAILSCFACSDKASSVVSPEKKVQVVQIKTKTESQIKDANNNVNTTPIREFEDDKSRISLTTVTFITSQTAPSKNGDQDSDMRKRLQMLKKKDLPERKAMEAQYVKQNLTKSKVIYLIEKHWSEEYTKFLKDHKIQKMRPINNAILLDSKNELKKNIKEKEDYFIITEKVWKFIQALYGGGPGISKDCNFPVLHLLNKRQEVSDVGMKNPLYLCFMISVFQCLLSIDQMNYYFLKKMFLETNQNKKKPVSMLMFKLVKELLDNKKTIEIYDYAVNFQHKFNPTQQHDAHQFLIYLIEQLQEQGKMEIPQKVANTEFSDSETAYTTYFNYYKSIADRAFAGQLETIVSCGSCGYASTTFSPFLEICLSMKAASLQECLKEHFSTEKLSDYYECEKCKNRTKATKQTSITKTPNYLIIVIKKFTSTGKKIDERISYNFKMDMKKHCKGHYGESMYSLNSLIVHKGTRTTKGHYYCFARRHKNDWMYLNDETVKEIESKDVIGRDPYILIYERDR